MGVKETAFDRVCQNIRDMVEIKRERSLPVAIGLNMVPMPKYEDQIMPLAQFGKQLRPDYLVIKHCSDNGDGDLDVNYAGYSPLFKTLRDAEALWDESYEVTMKGSKISPRGSAAISAATRAVHAADLGLGAGRTVRAALQRALREISHRQYRGRTIPRYLGRRPLLGVMNYLAGPSFNAQKMCASLCSQRNLNEVLDASRKGALTLHEPVGTPPLNLSFI
jgi:hypothetical protein